MRRRNDVDPIAERMVCDGMDQDEERRIMGEDVPDLFFRQRPDPVDGNGVLAIDALRYILHTYCHGLVNVQPRGWVLDRMKERNINITDEKMRELKELLVESGFMACFNTKGYYEATTWDEAAVCARRHHALGMDHLNKAAKLMAAAGNAFPLHVQHPALEAVVDSDTKGEINDH